MPTTVETKDCVYHSGDEGVSNPLLSSKERLQKVRHEKKAGKEASVQTVGISKN